VAKHIPAYSTDELAMIARAYSRFQMVHLQLFDAITDALPSRTLAGAQAPSLPPAGEFEDEPPPPSLEETPPLISSLVGFFEAYARLNIYDALVVQRFCDAIVKRRDELVLQLVVQATRAAAAFSFAHPGLLALASSFLSEASKDQPLEELEALARALEDLGVAGEGAEQSRLLLEHPAGAETAGEHMG